MRFILLLVYSVSPGFAKVTGNQYWFGIGLLMFVFYVLKVDIASGQAIKAKMVRGGLIASVVYAFFLSSILIATRSANEQTLLIGFVTFLVPLAIVALAGVKYTRKLFDDIPLVALAHAVIALAIYPPIQLAVPWLRQISEPLLEGTMALRLASVSGSLALSALMTISFGVAISRHLILKPGSFGSLISWLLSVLFLLCGIMTLQRAAWIGLMLILATALIVSSTRRISIVTLVFATLVPIFVSTTIVELPEDTLGLITSRLDSISDADTGAVSERKDQWVNVIHNFSELPMGYGPGQIGQAVRDTEPYNNGKPIYDGDYFRIISEYGFAGILLVVICFSTFFRSLSRILFAVRRSYNPSDTILSVTFISIIIQGIGTNITELYFVNALFWALLMYQWHAIRPVKTPEVRTPLKHEM